ncbi:MAG: hypothetical protein J5736_03085, partial [Bacilli bacterium]|nr:hypothetical protein [Bacilli bacterium]
MSEIKAVNTANYTHMFIRKMDFRQFPTEDWAWEGGYNFGYDIDEEGTGYTLRYDTAANEYNEKGIGSFGYGFAKIYAKRFFVGGDLIRMKLKYTGAKNCSISFRIYEEDGDRWAYQQAFSTLVEGEFTEVYVPYEAFSASYLGGNGRREFGFITNLQFGLTNVYGAGTLTYKDVEVIYRKSLPQFQDTTRHVHEDGMLEDFDSYAFPAEPFYKWSSSTENKDEFITLNQLQACGDGNVNAGCFYYKADMAAALYQIKLDVPEEATWNSLSIWLKDASERNSDSRFNYLGDVAAHATIGFYSDLGIQYTYEIPALPKVWTNFVIPFSEFKPNIGKQELLLHDISYFGIAFSYLYYTKDGTHFPTYHQSNPVYLDNISFVEADAFSAELIEKSIKADEDNPNRATLDDCEHYSGNNPMSAWKFDKEHPANSITLSDDVSPSGGNHSIKMAYQGYTSVSYALGLTLDASISDEENGLRPKGLLIDIKGDGKATIHINLYATSGSSTMQVRKTITVFDLEEGWARYQIGFGQFTDYVNPSTASINANNVTNVYKLTIGITNTDDSLSALYVDNIRLSNEFSRSTFKSTIL